ncbi:MAG: DUF2065 domain-containing protein [Candidatus Schekmanbacteria bacterium]|nr:MAG: DUF2065 domain-containing protein [Candidatus Schekmanbacteria bacterium]
MGKFLIVAIGLVLIIEGLPYFCFPEGMKKAASMIQDIDSRNLRVFGIIAMLLGLLLIYYGRGFFG